MTPKHRFPPTHAPIHSPNCPRAPTPGSLSTSTAGPGAPQVGARPVPGHSRARETTHTRSNRSAALLATAAVGVPHLVCARPPTLPQHTPRWRPLQPRPGLHHCAQQPIHLGRQARVRILHARPALSTGGPRTVDIGAAAAQPQRGALINGAGRPFSSFEPVSCFIGPCTASPCSIAQYCAPANPSVGSH